MFWIISDPTHNLKVVDLHGLVRPAARAESLHVIGRVDLHCALLHFAIDAHAVVDIVDLHTPTHTHTQGFRLACKVWESQESPHPQPSLFQHSSSPCSSNLTPWLFLTLRPLFSGFLFWTHAFIQACGRITQSIQLWVMMTLTAFHHVLIAFSNFILGGKKHSESYIFPLISSTSCPWSISRTKEAPLPLSTLPGSCNTHTTHTTPPFTKQTVPWNWGFNLHFSVCLYCKKNVLSF